MQFCRECIFCDDLVHVVTNRQIVLKVNNRPLHTGKELVNHTSQYDVMTCDMIVEKFYRNMCFDSM